jgi:hypothetical protein
MQQDGSLENIIYLIEQSDLDQTIKNILIRDLKSEGLTDFLREQIVSYCMEGIKRLDEKIAKAKQQLQRKRAINEN